MSANMILIIVVFRKKSEIFYYANISNLKELTYLFDYCGSALNSRIGQTF